MRNAVIEFYNFFHIVKKDEWIKILDEVKVKDRNYVDSVKQDLETVNGDITIDELKENVLRGTDKRTRDFLLSIFTYFKELLSAEFIKLKINQKKQVVVLV